jgi:hypothetical protein
MLDYFYMIAESDADRTDEDDSGGEDDVTDVEEFAAGADDLDVTDDDEDDVED